MGLPLEFTGDYDVVQRNFDVIARAALDAGNQSASIRFGTATATWPGGSANSNLLAVPHGLGTEALYVVAMPAGTSGPEYTVVGQPSGTANINFVMRNAIASPGAGATRSFYWVAVG